MFNVHVIVPSARFISLIDAIYMRGVRRIAGCPKYDKTALGDEEVRVKMRQRSLQCLLIRARLRYAARIVHKILKHLFLFSLVSLTVINFLGLS